VIEKLMKDTSKDRGMLDYVVLDLDDLKSIMEATKKFPPVDRLCLNAGGLTRNTLHEKSGTTTGMVSNVIGHSILSDELLKAGKISNDGKGRIVYIGSEVSRTMWSFTGMLPLGYWSFTKTDLDWAISKNYDGCCTSCFPLRRQLGDYKNAKIVGQLFYAAIAKENPKITVLSVSPGAVGGSFADSGYCPLNILKPCIPLLFRWLCVSHSMDAGLQRYTDALVPEKISWEAGSMVMSGYGSCCCLWGANGIPTDNRQYAAYFRDDELVTETAVKVREYQKKWFTAESIER
jgi:hypothetical protein